MTPATACCGSSANAVQAELRATDVPARYGGDEFIVLLPETPPKGAADVAERIRTGDRRAAARHQRRERARPR